jgi:hypothetical protein
VYSGEATNTNFIVFNSKDRKYNGQKTENTMAKRKRTKRQTMVDKMLHAKLKIQG